jgi:hypothetical protein
MHLPYPDAPEPKQVLASVIEKLAKHLSLPQESIKIVSVRSVLWRNSNMGCPSQGGKAAQEIISGYVIVLEVDGNTYTYHTDDTGRRAILCQQPKSGTHPARVSKPPEAMILAAREDLAKTLNVPTDKILFVFGEPEPCSDQDSSNPKEGWRLALYFQGKRYIYRICGDQIIPPQH